MVGIYTLSDPRTGQVRYVGCSVNPHRRLRENFSRACRQVVGAMPMPHREWLLSLSKVGLRPILNILAIVEHCEAAATEKRAIGSFRHSGQPILNECEGGPGTSGYKHRPESIEKFASSMRGKPKTQAHRIAMSMAARKRRYSPEERQRKRDHMNSIRCLVRPRPGEQNGRAKLTRANVQAIRNRYAAGGCTHNSLAQEYGVTEAAIRFAIIGQTWK